MADNKIKFLRGTSNEYAAAKKDSDTIYFTTDDGKLYIGDKEVSGSDIIIDDNMSDTSKNPVQNKVVNAALKSKADQTTVDNALAQKANLEDVTASLTGKSDIGHTHDDRYYTESEIDTKLNTKLNTSLKGAAKGLAELDSSGKVPSSQLPSYVDDVLEYTNKASFPATGESGKIYIAQDTNRTYRWSGSTYIEISPSLALGETSATAYRGDRGKVAYDHSQTAHAPSNAQANVIETVKVNGTALTPSSKAVDITVPSVGNGTITITQNGTTKGTFTTNQSGNTTIELTDNNATYGVATSSTLGLVKSGTDITVDSSGNVSVNDDSHNHVISNVDGLQSALDGKAASSHTHSAYVNQNAFSNVVVGSTTVSADNATDTLTLVAGSNVTITPDATNDKITIAATDTKYTHPTYTAKNSGLYKITVDGTGHVSAATAVTKADITALGIPASDKYHIEYGVTSVSTSKYGGTKVNFSKSFSTTPSLVVTAATSDSDTHAYGVADTTSATLYLQDGGYYASGPVSWIAIGGM